MKTAFIGSKYQGWLILNELPNIHAIITLDDRRDPRSALFDIKHLADERQIPFHVVANKQEFEQAIRQLKPDLCIVVCWYWLIRKDILDQVPHGFIGVHNSLLPKYRGGSPLVWQLINGEETVGATIFKLDEGMDSGPILGQVRVQTTLNDTIQTVTQNVADATAVWFNINHPHLLDMPSTEQNHEEATYCKQRHPKDGLIDWTQPAMKIYNFIRAQTYPYPGAYTLNSKGERIVIWHVSIVPNGEEVK